MILTLSCACGGIGEVWIIGTIVATIATWMGYRKVVTANEGEHHDHSH